MSVRAKRRDPSLRPSGATDTETVRITYAYLVSATLWLIVGTAAGLVVALKLNWPDWLAVPWLSFGRLRPIHTNTVFWGWSSMALVGLANYVVPRTSGTGLWSPRLAWGCLWIWHAAVLLGGVTLAAGITNGPQEYREWVWPAALLFGLGVVGNGLNLYQTVSNRRLAEIYVSNWYILGAFCWVTVLWTLGHLPVFESGISNVVIQGYYMHTAVGMWFTMLALGIAYYAIPRLLSRPVYSYALGVLGFWTNMLFYTLIGAHHFIFSPVAWWLQTAAILFSVGMMVPVWTGSGNLLLTFRGAWGVVRRSYALPFLATGVLFYALASMQGTLEAFRAANIYWHFTNFTVGHSHLAMYGFIAMVAWGGAYGLVPRLTGNEPHPVAVGIHFWLASVGLIVYFVSTSVAGVLQGFSWVAGESFLASVIASEPMWLWRTVGGLLMVASHLLFAWNVAEMRPRRASAAATGRTAIAGAAS